MSALDGVVRTVYDRNRTEVLEGAHLGLWLKLNSLGRRIMELQQQARADKVRRGCGCAGMGGRAK